MSDAEIGCPECDAGPWPDEYGAGNGRQQRMIHLYRAHPDARTPVFNAIDRL